jgi:hypothetical protein
VLYVQLMVTPPAIQLQSRQLLGRIQPFCDATTEDPAVTSPVTALPRFGQS